MIEIFTGKHVFYKSNPRIECKNELINILINDMNVAVNNVTIIYVDNLKLNRHYTVSCMTGFNKSSK